MTIWVIKLRDAYGICVTLKKNIFNLPFTPQEVLTRIKTHVQRHVKLSTTFKYHLRSQSGEQSEASSDQNCFFFTCVYLRPEKVGHNSVQQQFQFQLGNL